MAVTSWMSDYTAKKLEEIQEELLGEFDFGGLLGKDESDPALPEATDARVIGSMIKTISEKEEKVDCLHPHAKGCWMLLKRALTDPGQGIIRTSEAKIDNGAARFEELMSDLLPVTALMPEEPEEPPDPFSIASEDLPSSSSIDLLQERPDDSNPIDDEVDLAASLEFTPDSVGMFFSSIELGKVAGKPDSKKTKLLEVHKATTEELVVLIDLAIATGDLDTYAKAMEILKDVNPSAHRAIECLTGLPTIMALATSGHGERGGLGVAEFFQGWMSSGTGDIVGGLSGYKYAEKNNWSEYAAGSKGSKGGLGEWLRDRIEEWGPELAAYTAKKVENAQKTDVIEAQAALDWAKGEIIKRQESAGTVAEKQQLKQMEFEIRQLEGQLKTKGSDPPPKEELTPAQIKGEVRTIMGLDKTTPEGQSGSAVSGSAAVPTTPEGQSGSAVSGSAAVPTTPLDDREKKGTGGPGGEELPPDMPLEMPPAISKPPQDISLPKEGQYLYALFVQDLPDSGPEEKGKTLLGKPVTDSELYKLDAFLSTVRISQEAELELGAKKAPIDIDKFAGAFLPLPGSAETLEECGAVDPDPDQLGPAVVFGGWDPGVP